MDYVFMTVLFPLIDGRGITQKELLIGIPVWALAGFLYGYTFNKIVKKKNLEVIKATLHTPKILF